MNSATSSAVLSAIPLWIARIGWLIVGVFGSGALAAVDEGTTVAAAARWAALVVIVAWWSAGLGSLTFRSTATLTIARVIVPLSIPLGLWLWSATASPATANGHIAEAVITTIAGVVTTIASMSGEVGQAYVQASAYGAERRSLLRPPPVFLGLAIANWLIAAGAMVTWLELIRRSHYVMATVAFVAAALLIVWGRVRWHRLARRWLVLVPAALVVHDHLVLGETLMLPKKKVLEVGLAPPGSDALDITGDAFGPEVEIRTRDMETVMLAASYGQVTGKAIHAKAVRVAPSRPGSFVSAAHRNGIATAAATSTSAD